MANYHIKTYPSGPCVNRRRWRYCNRYTSESLGLCRFHLTANQEDFTWNIRAERTNTILARGQERSLLDAKLSAMRAAIELIQGDIADAERMLALMKAGISK